MPPRLKLYFRKRSALINRALHRLLPSPSQSPQILHKAMQYSILAGGKRFRPILVMAAAEACGKSPRLVLPTACALEFIHTYSLIHDDLPAMDDDDFRRGRPTSHKVFGEGLAILAGDALLTHAFDLIAQNGSMKGVSFRAVKDVIRLAARGAGTQGMIGGQVADIFSDRGRWKNKLRRFEKLSPAVLLRMIHARKTAALITASLLAGGRLANANKKQMTAFRSYGASLGMAFQVKDDILDVVGDKKKLGKKGSDRDNQKLTYPALMGLKNSQTALIRLVSNAHRALRAFGPRAAVLHDLADFVRDRDH